MPVRLPNPPNRVTMLFLVVIFALVMLSSHPERSAASGAGIAGAGIAGTGIIGAGIIGAGIIGAGTADAGAGMASAGARAATIPEWQWPLTVPPRILRPFVAPATAYAAGHRGVDLAAVPGAVVLAPADGVIHFAGTVVDRPVLSIRHPGELLTSLEPVQTTLAAGDRVRRGEAIGVVAFDASFHCEASCLHFGVRVRGRYLSPLNYLGGIVQPVLLPNRSFG